MQSIIQLGSSVLLAVVLICGCSSGERTAKNESDSEDRPTQSGSSQNENQSSGTTTNNPPSRGGGRNAQTSATNRSTPSIGSSASDPNNPRSGNTVPKRTVPKRTVPRRNPNPGTNPPKRNPSKESGSNNSTNAAPKKQKLAKAEPTGESGTNPGDKLPEISGKDIDGRQFKLSDYDGKVIMVDFWGDW
jgi:hypothetical protein